MSSETTVNFDKIVKKVEFFQFEWSSNLIAVCLKDSVNIYVYNENVPGQDESGTSGGRLEFLFTEMFDTNFTDFSWNPSTNLSSLKPSLKFAVSQVEFLTFYEINLTSNEPSSSGNSKKSFSIDYPHKIAFDYQKGELLAYLTDKLCCVWECYNETIKARFVLQSPGVNVSFHRDEHNKLMVSEKSGLIRIYNMESLKPIYTLMCINHNQNRIIDSLPIFTSDWSQSNPEIVIANTSSDMFIWNTVDSCLPEKIIENSDKLRAVKIAKFKDNIIGYLEGHDVSSKLNIFNFKTKQMVYQSKQYKLLNSFSLNASIPIIAIAHEDKVTILKLVN